MLFNLLDSLAYDLEPMAPGARQLRNAQAPWLFPTSAGVIEGMGAEARQLRNAQGDCLSATSIS
ncbi:hypothetical protein [Bacillus sp. SM2101]|uniref:hypothetical protein n=1 Tax=Bacillus sp. SM2101 TaxID=2805366 RepID=UPI001BDE9E2F|nr:hypothetical protein [Bacillus sp. SM2101]